MGMGERMASMLPNALAAITLLCLSKDSMSSQKLGYHEMGDVFVGPVRKMTRYARQKGYVKSLYSMSAICLSRFVACN